MILTLLKGYPDVVGRRQIFCGYGTGPAIYNQTTGDVLQGLGYERYIDCVLEATQDPTGTYYAVARPSIAGPRATWSLHWFVTATNAEVANGVNLSGYTLMVGGLMGEY